MTRDNKTFSIWLIGPSAAGKTTVSKLLYENIKGKQVFKYLNQLSKLKNNNLIEHSLNIENLEVSQDNLNSLMEYEKIEKLINKLSAKKNRFLEVGAGSGRTAKVVLSVNDNHSLYNVGQVEWLDDYSPEDLSNVNLQIYEFSGRRRITSVER